MPVTLITGYLGSGKTTLVNRVLSHSLNSEVRRKRIAVIVNEFGAIGIDGALIAEVAGEGKVVELEGGCICCVVTGEFRKALDQLPLDRLDHILIETSGAADPTSVVRLFWGAPELTSRYRLDGVVCVVDARAFEATAIRDPLAWLQASVADVQLLSKVESVPREVVQAARERLAALNPSSSVLELDLVAHADRPFPLEQILAIDAYRKPVFTPVRAPERASHGGLTSVSVSWEGKTPRRDLQDFFRALVVADARQNGFAEQVVRTKALVHVQGEDRPWLVQGVQTWLERGMAPKSYRGPNRLVVLGRGLEVERLEQAISRLRSKATP